MWTRFFHFKKNKKRLLIPLLFSAVFFSSFTDGHNSSQKMSSHSSEEIILSQTLSALGLPTTQKADSEFTAIKWQPHGMGDRLKSQALSIGSTKVSQTIENMLVDYGKARVNIMINDQGHIDGSADFLYSLYDSELTTGFIQFSAHTMENNRFITNLGLGQRFFPSKDLALGYNAFYDHDFSRQHSRMGIGGEVWYDWIHLGVNTYFPVSNWKDSKDFQNMEERVARGWDLKLKGYVPSYRQVAFTGGYAQWNGNHTGTFGSNKDLEKNPKIWSYGVEYTPFPLFMLSLNQQSSEHNNHNLQFALQLNWHFGMTLDHHLNGDLINQLRTIKYSRHDFVDRENKIILQYRDNNSSGPFELSDIEILPDQQLIVGEVVIFKVRLLRNNVPARNVPVQWTTTEDELPTFTSTTDSNGYAYISVPISSIEALQINASTQDLSASKEFAIDQFVLELAGNSNSNINNPITLTTTLLKNNTPADNITINWYIMSASEGVTLITDASSSPTNSNGQATATIDSSIAQKVTIVATATNDHNIAIAYELLEINFSNSYTVSMSGNRNSTVNTPVSLTTTLLNNSVPASGVTLSWSVIGNTTGVTLSTDSSSSPTNSNGQGIATIDSSIAKTVTVLVKALDNKNNVVAYTQYQVSFSNDYWLDITGNTSSNVNQSVALTASLFNSSVAAPGVTLSWSIVSDATNVSLTTDGSSSPTNSSGQATATINSSIAKTVTVLVEAQNSGGTVIASVEYDITFKNSYQLSVSGNNQGTINNPTALTATLLNGNLAAPNVTLKWSIIGSTTGVTVITDGASSPTNSNGQGIAKINSTVVKNVTVLVEARNSNNVVVASANFKINFTNPNYEIELVSGFNDVIPSDGNTTIQVKVTKLGAPANNVVINWSLTGLILENNASGNPLNLSSNLGTSTTNSSGIATMNYSPNLTVGKAGNTQINAAITVLPAKNVTALLAVGFGPPQNGGAWIFASSVCGSLGQLTQGHGGDPSDDDYQPMTKLPTIAQLKAIAGTSYRPVGWPKNTWSTYYYWVGVANGDGTEAAAADLQLGNATWYTADTTGYGYACLK